METFQGRGVVVFRALWIALCAGAGFLPAAGQTPALLLAEVWNESIDPTGWWISEKYDGVRGYWDGHRLRTRGGNPVNAPAYFLAELPGGVALDCELWLGRQRFEDTVSTVRRDEPDERWRELPRLRRLARRHAGQ